MIRDDGLYKAYVDELFLLFTNSVLWRDAAKALGEIGRGGEDVLTKKNFAVLKVSSTIPPELFSSCSSRYYQFKSTLIMFYRALWKV